jgi:hypothetical protein
VVDGTPQIHVLAAIRTTISSRCQRSLGRGRHRRRRAIAGPNLSTQLRTLSKEMSSPRSASSSLDISIA